MVVVSVAAGVVAVGGAGALFACFGMGAKRHMRKDTQVTTTIFLVRHGEAIHNIAEKNARRTSAAELEQLEPVGVTPGSEAYEEIVEGARQQILQSKSFSDAALSGKGLNEAKDACEYIEALCEAGAAAPSVVFVSPLERALKTACIVFPNHPDVRVSEDLRERMTGLPCDEPSPQPVIQKRKSFQFMVWEKMDRMKGGQVEDKSKLRDRTKEALLKLLEGKHTSIGIVSHKGFLRELERGPLGHPKATEFGNCEVRVYDVTLWTTGKMRVSRRYKNFLHKSLPHAKTSPASFQPRSTQSTSVFFGRQSAVFGTRAAT